MRQPKNAIQSFQSLGLRSDSNILVWNYETGRECDSVFVLFSRKITGTVGYFLKGIFNEIVWRHLELHTTVPPVSLDVGVLT